MFANDRTDQPPSWIYGLAASGTAFLAVGLLILVLGLGWSALGWGLMIVGLSDVVVVIVLLALWQRRSDPT